MDSLLSACYLAAGANTILLLAILYPSTTNLFKTRSSVSALLVIFSVVFLVQNVAAVYFDAVVPYTQTVEFEVMILTALQTVGFSAMFWVTYK